MLMITEPKLQTNLFLMITSLTYHSAPFVFFNKHALNRSYCPFCETNGTIMERQHMQLIEAMTVHRTR